MAQFFIERFNMKLWKKIKEWLGTPVYATPIVSLSISMYKDSLQPEIRLICESNGEQAAAQMLFELSEGLFFDDVYQYAEMKLSNERFRDIMLHLRDLTATKEGIQNLFKEAETNAIEQPYVSPSQVFAGVNSEQDN